jgi:hypothetical protein
VSRSTRKRRTAMLIPHPSRPGSMVAFVALPALLILLTLVSVPLRVFPVRVEQTPTADDVKAASGPVQAVGAASRPHSPCEPKGRVLEAARRAAGPDYYGEAAPQMDVVGDTCEVLLWRLPKRPGGYRIVKVDASGRVVRVWPGL